MPSDPKTTRTHIDRRLVDYDDKMRSLDLWRMGLVPPEVGIFDEPKRCYELNNEWAKIVMGLVSWLAETPIWRDAENEGYSAIEQILKFMIGQPCMIQLQVRQNPEDPCLLDYSIDGGENWTQFANILDCVTQEFIENSIIDALDTNTTIQDIIDNLTDGGTDNELPPTPTSEEPDQLCDAAYYMTDKIIDFIDETLTDASTITLEEFLVALLGLGGFDASLLKLFWDFIVANSYPNLLTDVQAARDIVAQILYCNELDKETVVTLIDSESTIGDEAQAALIGAINAITDGKWALWAFVGSQIDSGEDCSSFCSEEVCITEWDEMGLTITDGFVSSSFGNPQQSVRWVDVSATSPNNYAFRISVEYDFGMEVTIDDVEFDLYAGAVGGGAPNGFEGVGINIYDDSHALVSSYNLTGQYTYQAWNAIAQAIDETGRYVEVLEFRGSNALITGGSYIDNLCIYWN